jgi:hypothetical protein
VATINKGKLDDDMTLPPAFPQSFYATLTKAAKEAGISRSAFAIKAVKFYAAALKKQRSPSTKALGSTDAEKYAEMSSQVSKTWWAKLTPEEKKKRAQKAAKSRWAKK